LNLGDEREEKEGEVKQMTELVTKSMKTQNKKEIRKATRQSSHISMQN
jgi:hypothetical protein